MQNQTDRQDAKKTKKLPYLLFGMGTLLAIISYVLVMLGYSEKYKVNGSGEVNTTIITIGIFTLLVGFVLSVLGIIAFLQRDKEQTNMIYDADSTSVPISKVNSEGSPGSLNTLGVISFVITILTPLFIFFIFLLLLLFPLNIYLIVKKKVSGVPRILTTIALCIQVLLIIFSLTFSFHY
jgi:uncharacterized membrane protein